VVRAPSQSQIAGVLAPNRFNRTQNPRWDQPGPGRRANRRPRSLSSCRNVTGRAPPPGAHPRPIRPHPARRPPASCTKISTPAPRSFAQRILPILKWSKGLQECRSRSAFASSAHEEFELKARQARLRQPLSGLREPEAESPSTKDSVGFQNDREPTPPAAALCATSSTARTPDP